MVIIVGAGASGMMAAYTLSKMGIPVCVLEAQARPGGRIHTTAEAFSPKDQGAEPSKELNNHFSQKVDTGAEFIHGDLPLTLSILQDGNIPLLPAGGKFYRSSGGKWQTGYGRTKGWNTLLETMGSLAKDMPLDTFLEAYFGTDEDQGLRNSARGFAEGYDLADVRTVSTQALYREWTKEEGEQHRIEGGYGAMIDFMVEAVRKNGSQVRTAMPVREITWENGRVTARASNNQTFTGEAILITVPLAVLISEPQKIDAGILFSPGIPEYIKAAKSLGYGSVIKVLLEFKEPFWEQEAPGMAFAISDQPLPTWWTQAPKETPLLTGWLAGPRAVPYLGRPAGDILALGLESLERIFHVPQQTLKQLLKAWRVDDWSTDPFALGGYSFPTVAEDGPRRLLNTPVANTLFFAGEALYDGEHSPGTVEAALASGLRAAGAIAGRPR